MISTNKSRVANAAAIVALLSSADTANAQNGFRQVAIDFDATDPVGVVLPSICIGNFTVPKAMYTIEPAAAGETEVKILTNPQDLVETGYDSDNRLIYFKFILPISDTAEDAGVIIQFPSDQLASVDSCCSQSVEIKKGFTNFQSLTASTGAVVDATFAVQQANDMTIGVFSSAEVNVAVTETDGAKNSKVDVVARDKAMANIDGDITSLSCNDESDCMIAGVILDPNESRARGRSSIQTTSCEDIILTTDSICQSKTPEVTVSSDGPLVISGVKEECVNGGSLVGLGGPTETVAPTVSPQPTTQPVPTMSPTKKRKTRKPTTGKPTSAPTMLPTSSAPLHTSKQGVFMSIAIGGATLFFLLA